MIRRTDMVFVMLATVATTVMAALLATRVEWLWRMESAAADRIAVLGRKAPLDPSLVFLGIDESSIRLDPEIDVDDLAAGDQGKLRRALELMADGWPWSREVYALAIERLVEAGARCVVLDLTFPTPGEGDAALMDAIRRHSGRVVVAGHIEESGDGSQVVMPPAESIIPDDLRAVGVVGFDNFWSATDRVIRRAAFRVEGLAMPSLAAVAATKTGHAARIPKAPGSHRFRMVGPADTIRARPLFEIFAPDYWQRQHVSGAYFRDKIVVIGKAGSWLQDDHHTPLGIVQGPEIQSNAINAIITGEFIAEPPPWSDAALVAMSGTLAILLTKRVRRPFVRFGALVTGAGIGVFAVLLLYDYAGVLVPSATPLATWLLIGVSGFVADVLSERREKGHMRSTLERYVSRDVVEELLSDKHDLTATLGGAVRDVTVLFTDIRNFTYISASTDPARLVGQLNEYFTAMVDCVFAHGGTLDKFMGDALMAVWGNTTSKGPAADARAAVRCALAMRAALAKLNEKWRAENQSEFDIGIALNHGAAVCGNIGSPNRMEFTVIGDAVNIAWRLQERSKEHPGEILLGELLPPLLAPEFPAENIGTILVGGALEVEFARLVSRSEQAAAAVG